MVWDQNKSTPFNYRLKSQECLNLRQLIWIGWGNLLFLMLCSRWSILLNTLNWYTPIQNLTKARKLEQGLLFTNPAHAKVNINIFVQILDLVGKLQAHLSIPFLKRREWVSNLHKRNVNITLEKPNTAETIPGTLFDTPDGSKLVIVRSWVMNTIRHCSSAMNFSGKHRCFLFHLPQKLTHMKDTFNTT
jgi:hypothetical protein